LEYSEGYKARMKKLESKMKPLKDDKSSFQRKESYEDPD